MVDLAPPWAKEAARRGVELAEESLAEMKRHNVEVERLLTEIRDRLGIVVPTWLSTSVRP